MQPDLSKIDTALLLAEVRRRLPGMVLMYPDGNDVRVRYPIDKHPGATGFDVALTIAEAGVAKLRQARREHVARN